MKHVTRVLLALPMLMTLLWLRFLPDQVPMHYNLQGQADRLGPKWELLLLPGILLGMGLVTELAASAMERRSKTGEDGQQEAYRQSNAKVARVIILSIALLFTGIQFALLLGAAKATRGETDQAPELLMRVVPVSIGLFMMAMGNVMPKTRRNSAVGFRCGWTQYNETTWRRGNRFAGMASIAAGLVMILGGLLLPVSWSVAVTLVPLPVMTVVCLVYAHRVWRQVSAREPADKSGS
ncbi:MAG: DUF1648 domain-containing protein [Oscillospiraceae bacterium]|nr:DUF1648 domain-containing protein [Oscillospiraceae bacterium]